VLYLICAAWILAAALGTKATGFDFLGILEGFLK
jgi:hypothetical protein